jgi:adenosylcobinamide-GDP ribazoletransferase
MAALLAGHTVSRFWPLLLSGTRALAIAALWCVVPLLLMVLADGLPMMLLALAASAAAFALLRGRARHAPDGAHAMQQVCEVAFYLGAAFGVSR